MFFPVQRNTIQHTNKTNNNIHNLQKKKNLQTQRTVTKQKHTLLHTNQKVSQYCLRPSTYS